MLEKEEWLVALLLNWEDADNDDDDEEGALEIEALLAREDAKLLCALSELALLEEVLELVVELVLLLLEVEELALMELKLLEELLALLLCFFCPFFSHPFFSQTFRNF